MPDARTFIDEDFVVVKKAQGRSSPSGSATKSRCLAMAPVRSKTPSKARRRRGSLQGPQRPQQDGNRQEDRRPSAVVHPSETHLSQRPGQGVDARRRPSRHGTLRQDRHAGGRTPRDRRPLRRSARRAEGPPKTARSRPGTRASTTGRSEARSPSNASRTATMKTSSSISSPQRASRSSSRAHFPSRPRLTETPDPPSRS
jgi:hypothetical protein